MFDASRFSDIVGRIYDCVVSPGSWPAVLGEITEEFGGKIATLAVLDTRSNSSRFGATYGDARIIEPLVSTYAATMPFYDVVAKIPVDLPVTMAQLAAQHGPEGNEVLWRSRLWSEWFVPHRIGDAFCTNIMKSGSRVGALVINVDVGRAPITDRDLDQLGMIVPHIRRAVTIGDLFELERRDAELFRAMIDALSVGVLIVGEMLTLKYANPVAEKLLDQVTAGLRLAGGRICVDDPRSRRALEQTIAISLHREAELGGRAIGLPLPGSKPLVAHVLPLGQRRAPFPFSGDAAAAIFLATPGQDAEPAIDAIASLFGLTGAERRVASQVALGMSQHNIAAANRVSDATVKSQLHAIFEKTGASNQRELDRLLRELSAPLKRPT